MVDFFFGFLFFYFIIIIILLYNIVLVLPYINMNLPRVYTFSQSWTLFNVFEVKWPTEVRIFWVYCLATNAMYTVMISN